MTFFQNQKLYIKSKKAESKLMISALL